MTDASAEPSWRRRLLRPLLLVLAGNALVFAVYTLPRTLEGRSLAQTKEALTKDVERERRSVARLKERAETIHQNSRDLDRFYREVVTDESVERVLQDLDKAARAKADRSYRYSELKDLRIMRASVNLPIRGSYPQLVAFVSRLEAFPHFVTVDRIELQEIEKTGSLDVEVSAYFHSSGREPRPPSRGRR